MTPPGLILQWKTPPGLISPRSVDTVIEIPMESTTRFRIQLLLDHKSVNCASESLIESESSVCETDILLGCENTVRWSFVESVFSSC